MSKVKHHENMELRARSIEFRAADGDGRTVEGYAALTDNVTDMGGYNERVAKGAFDAANMTDVRALFNHDPNQVLARSASGTLKLDIDERGLKFRFSLPNTTVGNDLVEMVSRGDVSQCSFAFRVDEQEWEMSSGNGPDLRSITKISDVYDVALVTYPAYPDTSVALRSKPTKETPKEEQPLYSPGFQEDVAFFNQRLSAVK
jgi:HK97 family phage prohead protease